MFNSNLEITSSASKMSYQIEAMKILKTKKSLINNYIETAKKLSSFPKELTYVTSFYDNKTGSSGSFFKNNEKEDEYILAYAGTNPYADASKDLDTDIYDIGLGQGRHYKSCINFYKKVSAKYGNNIILTGHSLGGNIAQRVALEFNVPRTVIYNSAPLYIKHGVDLFMNITDNNRLLYTKRLRRYNRTVNKIEQKILDFTGEVIQISSEEDMLNRIMRTLGDEAVYISKDYILKDAGLHSINGFINKGNIIKNILLGVAVDNDYFVDKYKPIVCSENKSIGNLTSDKKISLDHLTALFLGNEQFIAYAASKMDDIDINKFMLHLMSKIEKNN